MELVVKMDRGARWAAVHGVSKSPHDWATSLSLSVVKNLPASAGDIRDLASIPESGRPPGGEHGNPLQYSCLGIPMDRKAWRAIVHRVATSQTGLKQLSMQAQRGPIY